MLALLLGSLSVVGAGGFTVLHTIVDAEADIKDLDVGDLDDMESDVSKQFLEEVKRKKMKPPQMSDFSDPMEWAQASMGGNPGAPQMTFAVLTQEEAEKLGKEGTEKLASMWTTMLESGHVSAQCYAADPGKILFVTTMPGAAAQVKKFVLSQPEVDWWEQNQKRYYPEGRSEPLKDHEERKARG